MGRRAAAILAVALVGCGGAAQQPPLSSRAAAERYFTRAVERTCHERVIGVRCEPIHDGWRCNAKSPGVGGSVMNRHTRSIVDYSVIC